MHYCQARGPLMCEFDHFSVIEILREINFLERQGSKNASFCHLED